MTLLIFLFGTVIGSFLNVAIRRGYRGESLFGRSHCESCRKVLSPAELIPVFSFLWQKGKCRSCGAALSIQYPLVEATTGILFAAAAYLLFPANFFDISIFDFTRFLIVLVSISAAIVIFAVDLKEKIIPEWPLRVLLTVGILASVFRASAASSGGISFDAFFWSILFSDWITAILIAFIFAALWFFSGGRWMGFGDVKLILGTSLIVGYPASIAAFLFSFWLGSIAGGILLLSRRASLRSQIPFGPFILLGALLAYFISPWFFETSRLIDGIYEIVYLIT